MAGEVDADPKPVSINLDNYRKLVLTYLDLHAYDAALFWADKVVALSIGNVKDVYWLAQCMFHLKQYHRAAHLLKSHNFDKTYILCNYLMARCLLEANDLNESLKVLNSIDTEVMLQNVSSDNGLFDDTPRDQVQSSFFLLKGKVLEAMDNRGLATDCYKQALQCDVYCYEAFDVLINHHMLSACEEWDLLDSLPISQQCSTEDAEVLRLLYKSKFKKYHSASISAAESVKKYQPASSKNTKQLRPRNIGYAPQQILSTPNNRGSPFALANSGGNRTTRRQSSQVAAADQEAMNVDVIDSQIAQRLNDSLDMAVCRAEKLYYNCNYVECNKLTESILKEDPYHNGCLPIHISCQVELKHSTKLFTLAHHLVDLYPDLAISWFAVGCYYYIIGNRDSARRYLAKATTLDRLFGPAWLAYGHSFAVESEHDQAMAAYFKASQLMRGCHLPLLYIGLECGLTNNVRLAEKFFSQAQCIAPDDPFVLHEMGVIAFQNTDYQSAEKYFRQALTLIKPVKKSMIPDSWEPLLNNLGHTYRKLKDYDQALSFHQQALVLSPQSAVTYSAIAYVYALNGTTDLAVDWFHKALGLKRDDTFSTTMLGYVIEQLSEEQEPYPDAPDGIPDFDVKSEFPTSSVPAQSVQNDDADMSIEVEMPDVSDLKD